MDFLRSVLPPSIKAILRPIHRGALKAFRACICECLVIFQTVIGRQRFLRLSHFISQELDTNIEVAGITFDASNYIPFHRAETILTKEPDTFAWISDCFADRDVFMISEQTLVYSVYLLLNTKISLSFPSNHFRQTT